MKTTYFFERPDGSVFACEAQEANDAQKKFKHIGTSDGSTYEKMMATVETKGKALHATVKALEARMERLIERLEAAEDDGKSTTAVSKRIDEVGKEIEAAQAALDEVLGPAIEKAFAAELKVAKKTVVPPPDMSVMYPMGSQNILQPFLAKRPR